MKKPKRTKRIEANIKTERILVSAGELSVEYKGDVMDTIIKLDGKKRHDVTRLVIEFDVEHPVPKIRMTILATGNR